MGRRRKRRDTDVYRPKRQPEPEPVPAARADSRDIARGFKDAKPANGEFLVRVRSNRVEIEGATGTQEINARGGTDTDTLLDAETAKAFTLLKGPITIERRGDMLRVSEQEGRFPTAFSIPVRTPAEDYSGRSVDFGKPATYSGESRINAVVRNRRGDAITTATIAKTRSGDFIVYQGSKESAYGGRQRDIIYSGPTLERAKRFVRNLPGEVNA